MRFPILFAAALAAFAPLAAAAGSCEEHILAHHEGKGPAERTQAIAEEIVAYQRLAEAALGTRAEAIRLYKALQKKTASGTPLTGADLLSLDEGAMALLAQRAALLDVAEAHECWLAEPPGDDAQEASIRIAGVAMSLSAALLLYDNYLSAIAPYRNDHELRQHLNRRDGGFERHAGMLNRIAANYASGENRQRVRSAIRWFEQHGGHPAAARIEGYAYMRRLIEQSPALNMVRKVAPMRELTGQVDFIGTLTIDTLFGLKNESTNLSSLLFGNAIGLVETRRGKLYHRQDVAARVAAGLQAGDILLEKTPFRLTDTFIPGHWGHAAMWVGSEADLRALGIWDHPVTRPHQEAIRAGQGIVEALRSGVEMNTVEHFLNIDDLGVLRHETLSREKRAEAILQALRQVGKPYDYNFDADTTHRIFCSKLVYLAYGDLQWPTSRMLGRATVSPDNIAARAIGDGPLSVSLLYHDGNEITESRREFMAQLLKGQAAPAVRDQQAALSRSF